MGRTGRVGAPSAKRTVVCAESPMSKEKGVGETHVPATWVEGLTHGERSRSAARRRMRALSTAVALLSE